MDGRRSRFVPGVSFVNETLERRVVLSGIGAAHPQAAAEVAARAVRKAATTTTLAVDAGTLGQPVAITVTVRAAASAGSPTGTVNIVDHGTVIGTLPLAPAASAGGTAATGAASVTLTQPPGDAALYFGKHRLNAVFVPSGAFAKSGAATTFTVGQPDYTPLAGGVKVATIARGSGPQIRAGQTANMLYTGYLAKNGKIFDDSALHGGTPFGFTLGAGQVVPGFDAGTAGMQAGETRIISIPPAEGYGDQASGPIPGHSTLIFVVTLESIS